MQMMFFYLFVLTIFFTTRNVESIKNNINFYDDIFYGDSYGYKSSNDKNSNNQIYNGNIRQANPNIKNFNDYFTNYKALLLKPTDFIVKEKGKCLNFYNLKDLFFIKKNSNKDIEENLNSISHYLNDLNFIFKDEFGNFLIYSVCKNFFFYSNGGVTDNNENYVKCFQRFIFISKIDFSFYSFLFSGEKIPTLVNFSVDFAIDDFSHKKYLFLFGGIDAKGNHNSDIYRFDIDYSFGNININKITSIDLNSPKNIYFPQGLSDSSYNIIQYEKENLSYKKNYLSIIFGGNNDENISNKLYAYKHETSTWLIHSINADSTIIPRKGHSAIITKNNLFEKDHLKNENVIKTYILIIFGGKSINTYLNDIIIFTINYAVLDDKIYFDYKQLENNKDIIGDFPEPREGHKSFMKGDYLYIYGGCNYNIKKCYHDTMYKLNLKKSPFIWEKEILIVNQLLSKNYEESKSIIFKEEKIKFNNLKNGEKMSNFLVFKDIFINIGICKSNEDDCKNRLNFIVPDSNCFYNNNNSNFQDNKCGLQNEITDSKFYWNFECKSNNLNKILPKKEENLKINNKSKINKREQNENLNVNSFINIAVEKDEDEKFNDVMNNIINSNNLNTLLNNDNNDNRKEEIKDKKLIFISKKNKEKRDLNNKGIINEYLNINDDEKNSNVVNVENNKIINNNQLKNNFLKLFKENILNNQKKIKNEKIKPILNYDKKLFSNNMKNNFYNNSSQIKFLKKNKKIFRNNKNFNEDDLIDKIVNIISNNLKNSSLNIYDILQKKIQNYFNQTETKNNIINANITEMIKENFNNIENENLKLKQMIFNNEIKPLLKDNVLFKNNSEFEINFLNFDEKLLNISERIKRKKLEDFKELSLKEYKKNVILTKNIEKNISEIKNIISKENEDTKKNLNNMISKLIKKIENIDNIIQNKFSRVSQFMNNQEKINNSTQEYLLNEEIKKNKAVKQCFNGFLVNNTYCQCVPGFAGENCEIILTCEDDCSGNGNCQYGKCFCNPGFSGAKCEKEVQCEANCNNRGKCYLGKCYCEYGFDGTLCENKIKCLNDCRNKGICFRGKCLCEPGFTGEDCSQTAIKFNSCKNNCNRNGVCKKEKCFCYPGFSGKYCEIKHKFACPSNIDIQKKSKDLSNNSTSLENRTYSPCSGNGLCKYGMCFCYPGYIGQACEKKEQCKNNCSLNGICIKGKCICKNNSINDDCSEYIKNDNNSTMNNNSIQINPLQNKILFNLNKTNKEIFDFHFIQIDKDTDSRKNKIYLNSEMKESIIDNEIKKAIKIDQENENIKEKISLLHNEKSAENKNKRYSLIDEKNDNKYNNIPEGIYVGKETVEKIIYTIMILLSIIFSILITLYLNKKFYN